MAAYGLRCADQQRRLRGARFRVEGAVARSRPHRRSDAGAAVCRLSDRRREDRDARRLGASADGGVGAAEKTSSWSSIRSSRPATGGGPLARRKTRSNDVQHAQLLPLATVITPNMDEAQVLRGKPVSDSRRIWRRARDLRTACGAAVLVKGGHLDNESAADQCSGTDDRAQWFATERVPGVRHPRHRLAPTARPSPPARGKGLPLAEAVHAARRCSCIARHRPALRLGEEVHASQPPASVMTILRLSLLLSVSSVFAADAPTSPVDQLSQASIHLGISGAAQRRHSARGPQPRSTQPRLAGRPGYRGSTLVPRSSATTRMPNRRTSLAPAELLTPEYRLTPRPVAYTEPEMAQIASRLQRPRLKRSQAFDSRPALPRPAWRIRGGSCNARILPATRHPAIQAEAVQRRRRTV